MTLKLKLILAVCIAIMALTIDFFYVIFNPSYHLKESSSLVVEKNSSYENILNNIKAAFSLSDKENFFLNVYLRLKKYDKKIKHGDYTNALANKANMSLEEIVTILKNGSQQKKEMTITVIEGWSKDDIDNYFKTLGLNTSNFIDELTNDEYALNFKFLNDKPASAPIEGYLFPDTYKIYSDSVSYDIIIKMLQNFDAKVNESMRSDALKNGLSFYQTITLASIIEKEVRTLESKKKVSGIFHKRLKDQYPLQSDATINFITKKGTVRPLLTDLEVNSQYNTYKYIGLPPGPICNPGIDSIIAAIYPDENDYYFFLTSDDGGIYFGKNYEEHLLNIKKYLK